MSRLIYADNAATTQMDIAAFEAMKPFLTNEYGNASQPYAFARKPKKALQDAREIIASCIGATPEEIIFTSGGTESDNWAIKGSALLNANKHATITSAFEHHAVLHPCQALERSGYPVAYMWPSREGYITAEILKEYITGQTHLTSVMFANNEIGTVQPIKELCAVAHENGSLFHTDAVQAVGHIPVDVHDLGIDMLSASAHKFNGPKGVGFLYIRNGLKVMPYSDGGAQEFGLRAGTENVAGIVGLGKAIEIASNRIEIYNNKLLNLRNYFIDGLNNNFENIRINGDLVNRLPGNVNVSFRNKDASDILFELDKNCICASGGSACSSGNVSPSHVLMAIGVPSEWINGTVRFTLGEENSKDEIDYVLKCMKAVVI